MLVSPHDAALLLISMLRGLPEGQQEAWAQYIELAMKQDRDVLLAEAQWAGVDWRLANASVEVVEREDVLAWMRAGSRRLDRD